MDKQYKKINTKLMVIVGIMGGISAVLMLFEIPFIAFLKMDFSDIPSVIVSMLYGPAPGILVELIKNILKIAFGTKTALIGELANFIIGASYVIPIGLTFSTLKKKAGIFSIKKSIAIFSLAIISMTLVGALANYFILIPFYGSFFGGVENIIKLVPFATTKLDVIMYAITPFNLVKGCIIALITLPLYRYMKHRA